MRMLLSALLRWLWTKLLFWRYRSKAARSRTADAVSAAKAEQIKTDSKAREHEIVADSRKATVDDLNKLFGGNND